MMLIYRLALRLGKSLDELENTIDEVEFDRWVVFDAIEPIGDRRLDVLAGYICASHGGGKPSSFMPDWGHWIGEAAQSADDDRPVPDAATLARIKQERELIAFKAEMFKLMGDRGSKPNA